MRMIATHLLSSKDFKHKINIHKENQVVAQLTVEEAAGLIQSLRVAVEQARVEALSFQAILDYAQPENPDEIESILGALLVSIRDGKNGNNKK